MLKAEVAVKMANIAFNIWFSLCCLVGLVQCYGGRGFNPIGMLMREGLSKDRSSDAWTWKSLQLNTSTKSLPIHTGPLDELKERHKIESLPGQPNGVDFNQYSGYVTVDFLAGRALYYYFVESPQNSTTKPLVLWLNGGPGCSSFGNGAMMELGPFRVNKDGRTLYLNEHAWNKEANIIFLESPAGVGFSYSNTTSDYESSGDYRTASDSYIFLLFWLEIFPEYKTRDFFIAGESYAGHYVPQLAQTILLFNSFPNRPKINLRGIAIGNPYVDRETAFKGKVDYYWSHALISDEIYMGLALKCNVSSEESASEECIALLGQAHRAIGNIDDYDIYAPLCNSSADSNSTSAFDPCSENYVHSYLNIPQVQEALHANVTGLPDPWESCRHCHPTNANIYENWKDSPATMLPSIQELMSSGMQVWIYSGDTDGVVPVTSSRYFIKKLGTSVRTPWYPWYTQGEVGGYAVEYQNLTFVTVRGSGHFVPSYQPARALHLFCSFLNGTFGPTP